MAASSDNNESFSNLVNGIDVEIPLEVEFEESLVWGKLLDGLPTFTKREIKAHMQKCGKNNQISKRWTGDKSSNKNVTSQLITFTLLQGRRILVKAKCKASMKKPFRHIQVYICKKNMQCDKSCMHMSCRSEWVLQSCYGLTFRNS